MKTPEIFRECLEGPWAVSNRGRLKTIKAYGGNNGHRYAKGKILKWTKINSTHKIKQLYRGSVLRGYDGKKRMVYAHQLVAHYFIGPRPKGMVVNHIDGRKCNNHASNLRYITLPEAIKHANLLGNLKGFNQKKIIKMIELFKAGVPCKDIAKQCRCAVSTVQRHVSPWRR